MSKDNCNNKKTILLENSLNGALLLTKLNLIF
jgi:hypothetical protein